MFLPHPRVKVSIVGSLHDREVACSASDRQGSNFESCVWRTVSSQSSHHPQEVLLAQFSLYVHKGGLNPDSFHFYLSYLSSPSRISPICRHPVISLLSVVTQPYVAYPMCGTQPLPLLSVVLVVPLLVYVTPCRISHIIYVVTQSSLSYLSSPSRISPICRHPVFSLLSVVTQPYVSYLSSPSPMSPTPPHPVVSLLYVVTLSYLFYLSPPSRTYSICRHPVVSFLSVVTKSYLFPICRHPAASLLSVVTKSYLSQDYLSSPSRLSPLFRHSAVFADSPTCHM